MSFTTNKPTNEDLSQSALHLQLSRKSASTPAFRPQIIRSLRMHPTLAAVVAGVVFFGLVGFSMFQKSVYLAISQVYEEPATPKLLSDSSAAIFDANKYETFLGEQIQMVQRLDVLTAAISTLPATTYQEFGATPAQAAEAIQSQIKVVRVATSYQISISLKGTNSQKTADIVNAITTAYLGAVQKVNAAEYDQRAQLLGEERQRIESELQTARAEQAALGASIGVASPTGEGGNPYDAELSGIRAQLVEARAAHDVAAAQLASLSGVGQSNTDGLKAAADELIAGDAGLGSMKTTISQRKAQLNEQMSGMTPNNPVYKQDQDQIAELDQTLDRMTTELRDKAARRLQDKLRTDLQRTGDIESRLNGQLARQIAKATSAAPRLQRAAEVAADIQRLDSRMAAVDDALRSLRLEVNGPAQVRLSLAATAPEAPEANRKKQLLLLSLPLALLCGIAAAVIARKQNKRIYGGVDIDEVVGFPPMAILPARGDVSQRVFEEYVLRLAAGIESAYRTSGARTFLMTAVSLTTDIRPLISALTRKFEEIGVNVVVASASDMLAPTSGVPTGVSEPMTSGELERVVELWSKGFVAANVAKMKTEHGLVLIESAALLNCAQTEYVARCSDATILIVECGVTNRQELFRSAELLHRLNVTGIGVVLEEIQLRYADSEFRAAIEALDHRQSDSVRQDRRPRVEVAPLNPIPAADIVVPAAAASIPEHQLQPQQATVIEKVTEEPVQEIQSAISEDPILPEAQSAPLEVEYEPGRYHELIEQSRATQPFEQDSSWQLPVFFQVANQTNSMSAVDLPTSSALVREPSSPEIAVASADADEARRTIVENVSDTGHVGFENTISQPVITASDKLMHEKIAPRLSPRRVKSTSDGDPGMKRNTSWIGRLLRFDAAPVVSIVPDAGEEDADEDLPTPTRGSSAVPPDPAVVESEYNASLANRLNQISGIRQAVQPAVPATNIAEFKESHRLQIRPPEPVEAEVVSAVPVVSDPAEGVLTPPEVSAEVAPEVEPKVRRGPAAWATTDETTEEVVPTQPEVSVIPLVEAPAPAPVVRRRFTFRELMEMTARESAATTDHSGSDPNDADLVREDQPEFDLEAPRDEVLPIIAQVSEFGEPEPVVEDGAPEPAVHAQVDKEPHEEESVAPVDPILEPVHEPSVPEIAAAHVLETVPVVVREPLPEPVSDIAAPSEIASTSDVEQSWGAVSASAEPEVPEFHFSDRFREEAPHKRKEQSEYNPYRPTPYDLDDIEPVYHEASRSLNTGRWDPIPPLRPSMDGWRDRPSPYPATRPGEPRSNNEAPRDGFNSYPPQRWIPEDTPLPPEPEPVSERVLSRQWGLLSKFQQARLGTLAGAATASEDDRESSTGGDRPPSNYRDHRS